MAHKKLSPLDQTIKQNLQHLFFSLDKNQQAQFEKAVKVAHKKLSQYLDLDLPIMPSAELIFEIERYFERYYGLSENTVFLKDENLLLIFHNKGITVEANKPLRHMRRIKDNIRHLRYFYRETQKQLGEAIGVSPNAISNYENPNNDKLPNQEQLIALAQHFNISIDVMLYGNLKIPPLIDMPYVTEETMNELFGVLFPSVEYADDCPKKRKNQKFLKALSLHNELAGHALDGTIFDYEPQISEMMYLYREAIEEGGTEGAANHLCWLMWFGFYFFSLSDQLLADVSEATPFPADAPSAIISKYILPMPAASPNSFTGQSEKMQQSFLEKYEPLILEDLQILAKSDLYELAYYYIAFRQTNGIISNSLSRGENRSAGEAMMDSLYLVGNEYAMDYCEYCKNTAKKYSRLDSRDST